MTRELVVSPRARSDLRSTFQWIARDNLARASSFTDELEFACAQIVDNPFRYPPFGRGVRKRTYRNYLILFRVSATAVTIARVIHGSRQRRRPN